MTAPRYDIVNATVLSTKATADMALIKIEIDLKESSKVVDLVWCIDDITDEQLCDLIDHQDNQPLRLVS